MKKIKNWFNFIVKYKKLKTKVVKQGNEIIRLKEDKEEQGMVLSYMVDENRKNKERYLKEHSKVLELLKEKEKK